MADATPDSVGAIMDAPDADFAQDIGVAADGSITDLATLPRDEHGRFVSKDATAQTTPVEDGAPVEQLTDLRDGQTPEPEAQPVAQPVDKKPEPVGAELPTPVYAPDEKLLTKFAVSDEHGELDIPKLRITYEANGKTFEHQPLDKVVLMAQLGHFNQQKLDEGANAIAHAASLQTQIGQMQQYIESVDRDLDRLYRDENAYIQARDRYAQEHTPERRLAQMEQRVRAAETQVQIRGVLDQGVQFADAVVTPQIEQIKTQNPLVTDADLQGRFALLVRPYLVAFPDGVPRVHPQYFPEIQRMLEADLTPYAQGLQQQRASVTPAPKAKATPDQIKAQAQTRKTARVLVPAGQVGSTRPESRTITRAQDVLDSPDEEFLHGVPPLGTIR